MTFYSRLPTPSQAHPPIEIIVRCAPGADEWLAIVGPNGTRGVFVVSVRELRSHHRFSIATLERCWPPTFSSAVRSGKPSSSSESSPPTPPSGIGGCDEHAQTEILP